MDDMSFGLAYGLKKRAEGAEAAVARLLRSVDSATQDVVELADKLKAANQRIRDLELSLLVKKAHAEGLRARIKGFVAAHPDSPELRDTGKRYKDGDVKNITALRYEQAFDAFLAGNQIANPAQYRAD